MSHSSRGFAGVSRTVKMVLPASLLASVVLVAGAPADLAVRVLTLAMVALCSLAGYVIGLRCVRLRRAAVEEPVRFAYARLLADTAMGATGCVALCVMTVGLASSLSPNLGYVGLLLACVAVLVASAVVQGLAPASPPSIFSKLFLPRGAILPGQSGGA